MPPITVTPTTPEPDGATIPPAPPDLGRVVEALASCDAAFALTFIDQFGESVAGALRAAGVAADRIDDLVHEVALALVGRAADSSRPRDAVDDAIADVLADLAAADAAGANGSDEAWTGPRIRWRGPIETAPAPPVTTARSLHLVDIENLAGGPSVVHERFADTLHQFRVTAEVGECDQVVMAADVGLYRRTAFDVDGGRYLFGYGPDGADDVLLREAPVDWVAARFDRLVIGSGDHAFAALARGARQRGVHVVVVALPGSLANVLRWEASEVSLLPGAEPVVDLTSAIERVASGRPA